jgi:multidrug efflux pump subunit AcrA (membrane-fusion protein)
MRKFILFSLLLLVALNAFGHAGEVHKYMGTVTALHDDGSFMLKKTDGETTHVVVATTTAYRHADGRVATRADLKSGNRVVVTISTDGKTATEVKLAAARKK